MRHRLLGPSGLRVSELCLGTLTFGEAKGWGADDAQATAILGGFTDAGGTFIDTAPNYSDGRAEEIVGRFVAQARHDYVVATKFTASSSHHPLAGGNSRKSLVRSVEASLRRLGSDYIDLMWLHYWDGTAPLDEILRALDDLVAAGKLLYVGISDTPAWLVSRAATLAELRGWSRVIAIQGEYNLAARDAERELLPMAEALDLGVVCWGPLAAGALAGGPDPRRRATASLPLPVAQAAEGLAMVAAEVNATSLQLALAWLLRRRAPQLVPVVGARTPAQLSAVLAAMDQELSDETLGTLDAIVPTRLGFPHDLIRSSYLRKLALGDPAALVAPNRSRA